MVVSKIFCFHPYLGKIPILTNIFQRGWNHQPEDLLENISPTCGARGEFVIAAANKLTTGQETRWTVKSLVIPYKSSMKIVSWMYGVALFDWTVHAKRLGVFISLWIDSRLRMMMILYSIETICLWLCMISFIRCVNNSNRYFLAEHIFM